MKIHLLSAVMLMTALVAGCNEPADRPGGERHGRYLGIGIYSAGELWSRMIPAPSSKNQAAATLADDDHVIVLIDSQTGEVRQCGNYTGHCFTMNPWRAVPGTQSTPIQLSKHAAELIAEAEAASDPSK